MHNEIDPLQRQIEELKAEILRLRQSENEAVYRSLFENNHAVMLLIDPETAEIKDANPAACAYYGWSREALKKLRIDEINTLNKDELLAQMQLARTEKRRNFFFKHRRSDGTIRDVEVYSGPLTLRGQTLLYSIVHDITERRQAEEAQRQGEEKFRLAFHTSPDSINFNRLSDGVYIDINDGFTKLTGYTREDSIGKSSIDLNIWYDPKDRQRLLKALQNEGFVENIEARFRRKNGQIGVGLMSARVLRLHQEDVILSITRDITERKQVEDALRESEDKYSQIVESLTDAILVWSSEDIIYANPAAFKLFRANQPGDLIGKRYLDLVYPDDRPESAERIKKSKNEKWIAPRREHRMITADGQVIQVESTGVPIQSQGQIVHFAIFSDISKRKRAEEELRLDDQRMEALLQLNQMTHASMQEIASFAMEEAVRLTQSRIGYLAFADQDEGVLTMYAWSRSAMAECAIENKPIVYPVADTGLWGETVRQRKAIITNDYQASNPLKKGFPKGHVRLERHLGVPIFDGDRIVIVAGVGDKGADYDERDIRQLELLMSGMWRIVQRKRAEDALRDSEARFRALVESAPDAIFVQSAGRFNYLNPAACRIFGASQPEDLLGKDCMERIAPEYLDLIQARIRAQRKTGEPAPLMEQEYLRLDGSRVQVETTALPIRYQGEDSHIVFLRDITARKLADEKLKETEKNYRELAESLPQVIFEVDLNGTLTYVNHNAYALFGYSPEEISKDYNVLEAFIPEDRERVAQNIMLNIQGQKIGNQQYTAVSKDGTRFPVAVHANRVFNGQTATGVRGILIDLRPNKRAEEEKRQLEIQLQQAQKMEAIGALAGGIAHDFNNILSAIIGYSELAMLNEGAEHCAVELKEALKAANRAKDLVKQILAFSRQTDEERMPVRVALVAKEAVKFLRATIPATIEIKTRIDEKSGAVLANSVELHQIIINLCTNSQHAIGEKAGVLEVVVQNTEIDLAQKNDLIDLEIGPYVRISVMDNGYGMTPEVKKRIFDPYFTTKEKGVGTGLGLAVVHGIVKKYGGAIRVESELGKGTTFHIYLPKVKIAASTETGQPKPLIGGSERILFVDDEKMIVDIGQQALQRLGYDVVSRTSPTEALELFKAKPGHFDLVITDQTMPGMTGDALAKELMSIRPNLPVIICTGYSQTIDQERAKQKGIRAFVMKPILINEIAAAVRKALTRE